jgi:hypothetical protein
MLTAKNKQTNHQKTTTTTTTLSDHISHSLAVVNTAKTRHLEILLSTGYRCPSTLDTYTDRQIPKQLTIP